MLRSMIPRRRVDWGQQVALASKGSVGRPWRQSWLMRRPQWSKLIVDDWYGEGPREVEVATDTAVWYHSGKPPVAIRWVLIRDPQEALQTTSLAVDPSGAYLLSRC